MQISTALLLSDRLGEKAKRGEKLTQLEWGLRVLAGAYRRQKQIIEKEEKKNQKKFIQVEYDENYFGGEYDKVGKFLLVPEEHRDRICNYFTEKTGLDSIHIVHWSPDELVNENGDPIES